MTALRLLLIRMGLRRATLGDVLDRLMQHRAPREPMSPDPWFACALAIAIAAVLVFGPNGLAS